MIFPSFGLGLYCTWDGDATLGQPAQQCLGSFVSFLFRSFFSIPRCNFPSLWHWTLECDTIHASQLALSSPTISSIHVHPRPFPTPQSLILVRPCSNVGNVCRATRALEAEVSTSVFHRNPMHPRTPHPSAILSIWALCLCSNSVRTEARQLPNQRMRTEKRMVNPLASDTNRKNIRVFCCKLIHRIHLPGLSPSRCHCQQKKSVSERKLLDDPAWSVI